MGAVSLPFWGVCVNQVKYLSRYDGPFLERTDGNDYGRSLKAITVLCNDMTQQCHYGYSTESDKTV